MITILVQALQISFFMLSLYGIWICIGGAVCMTLDSGDKYFKDKMKDVHWFLKGLKITLWPITAINIIRYKDDNI